MRDTTPKRLISASDLTSFVTYSFLALVGWFVPLRWIWPAIGPMAVIHSYVRRPSLTGSKRFGDAIVRTSYQGTPRSFDIKRLHSTYHEIALMLRLFRPGGGRLPTELEGREHIDAGLARGHGVILLVCNAKYSDYVAKAAMAEAGIPLSHLSIPGHRGSGSWFSRVFTTRLHVAAENRFLRERIVMSSDAQVRSLRTLERRLRDNNVVSITAITGASSIKISCLDGTFELGRAAPAMSRKTGAIVLPVFTTPSPSGSFIVRVEAPLRGVGDGARFETSMAQAYGAPLERFLREDPTIWIAWGTWDPAPLDP